jgi:hypothetical protein
VAEERTDLHLTALAVSGIHKRHELQCQQNLESEIPLQHNITYVLDTQR